MLEIEQLGQAREAAALEHGGDAGVGVIQEHLGEMDALGDGAAAAALDQLAVDLLVKVVAQLAGKKEEHRLAGADHGEHRADEMALLLGQEDAAGVSAMGGGEAGIFAEMAFGRGVAGADDQADGLVDFAFARGTIFHRGVVVSRPQTPQPGEI